MCPSNAPDVLCEFLVIFVERCVNVFALLFSCCSAPHTHTHTLSLPHKYTNNWVKYRKAHWNVYKVGIYLCIAMFIFRISVPIVPMIISHALIFYVEQFKGFIEQWHSFLPSLTHILYLYNVQQDFVKFKGID